ncbi:MAG: arylesterase, partial [bacterium]
MQKFQKCFLGLIWFTINYLVYFNSSVLAVTQFNFTNNLTSIGEDSTNKKIPPQIILFLGNSLTAGYGLDPAQSFPSLIQQKIDTLGWNFEVINAGLSGETSSGGLRRINWLLNRKIDVLVLELGGNDALRGILVDITKKNLQSIIEETKSKYPNVKIVIAGMMAPPNLGQDYTSQFRSIFPELAEKNDALLLPFLLEGVGGNPELNLPDGIHPTAQGHKIVAENVW